MTSALDAALHLWATQVGLPVPVREFRFHPPRKWRFDYCWPAAKVALEINGGVYSRGRHTRGTGYLRDLEKINRAQLDGWIVLQCAPHQVGQIVPLLREALGRFSSGVGTGGANRSE